MNGVRIIARVWGLLGWLTFAISIIALLFVLSQMGRYFGPRGGDFMTVAGALAGSLVPVFLMALGPFTVWAGLTAVCELHAQGERSLEALDDLKRGNIKNATAAAAGRTGALDAQ